MKAQRHRKAKVIAAQERNMTIEEKCKENRDEGKKVAQNKGTRDLLKDHYADYAYTDYD